ncbi:MAG: hypothetical protein ACE15F_04965 [bacterium]
MNRNRQTIMHAGMACILVLTVSFPAYSQSVTVTTPEELAAAVSVPNNVIYVGEDLVFEPGGVNVLPFITGNSVVLESDPAGPVRTITLLDSAKWEGVFADNVTVRRLRFVANDTAAPAGEAPYAPGFFIALFGNTQNDNSNQPGGDPTVIEHVTFEDCVFTGFGGAGEPGAIARIDLDAVSITFRRCFLDYTGGQAVLRYGQFGGQPGMTGQLVIDQCTVVGYPVETPNQPLLISLQSLADSSGEGIEVEITNSILIPGGNVDPAAGFAPFGPAACWGHGDKLLAFKENHNLLITGSGNFGGGNEKVERAPDATDLVNVDPQLTDITAKNFILQPGSPAIGAGAGGINIGADQTTKTDVPSWLKY